MTEAPAAPAGTSVADHVRDKLAGDLPVTFADIKRGLPRASGKAATARDGSLRELLAEAVREGRAFAHPTGRSGAERYWARDEQEVVRDALLTAAGESPRSAAQMRTAARADGSFVERMVGQLEGDGRLFRVPGRAVKYTTARPAPPPGPLDRPAIRRRLDTLVRSVSKLLADAGVSADELFAAVRGKLPAEAQPETHAEVPPAGEPRRVVDPAGELDELILKAVAADRFGGVLSLADLRAEMPPEYRGPAFDAAVLRLAAARRVRITKDADPADLTPAERAGFVADDHGHVFRTIARREETA